MQHSVGRRPDRAFNIQLGPPPTPGQPQMKPFGVAIDVDGNVWINDNRSDTISVISPKGRLIEMLPSTYQGKTVLSHPVGTTTMRRARRGESCDF